MTHITRRPPANVAMGVLLIAVSTSIVPFMDAIAKHLSATLPISELLWARFVFQLLFLLPLVLWRHGLAELWPRELPLQVGRGLLMLGSTALYFWALSEMPIPEALSLILIAPLIVTALSPWLLGEQVGVRQWIAVSVGFAGALLIIRPGFGVFQWASLLALSSGVGYALFIVATRKLGERAPPLITLTATAVIGSAVMSVVAPFDAVLPSGIELLLMVAMGAVIFASDYLMVKGFDYAPASVLAPMIYGEIVMSTTVGYVFFDDFPDAVTWAGVAVIIGSGLYVSLRERHPVMT
ncbi:MAG: DMT family transporter [Alphaproteobacteria bacterium]|nr:DMT family transporter [Alphaproteobacteria bacterium]